MMKRSKPDRTIRALDNTQLGNVTGGITLINQQTPADWNEIKVAYKDNLTAWGASSIDLKA